jgi:4-amino-4-deoxy-L-arabinose transferase-like glycosyltransferase
VSTTNGGSRTDYARESRRSPCYPSGAADAASRLTKRREEEAFRLDSIPMEQETTLSLERDSRLSMSRLGRALGGLTLLLGVLAILHGIREMPLLEPDEARNAEVAREMLENGEWLVPRFHGLPYLDKPVLFFDSVCLSYALFGRSEGTSRLPSVCFALLTLLATFVLGTRLLGRDTAFLGAAVLATTPLFVGFARMVIFDMALTCFVTLALLFAEEGRRGWTWGFPAAWGVTALAVLTKGPVGLLLPLLGALGLFVGQGPPYRLGKCFRPLNLAIFLALTLPWVLTMEARNPGFLHYALVVESFERLTRPTFHRTGPAHYYVPVLFLGFFPWSLAIVGGIPSWCRRIRDFVRQRSPERGLLLAAGVIMLFWWVPAPCRQQSVASLGYGSRVPFSSRSVLRSWGTPPEPTSAMNLVNHRFCRDRRTCFCFVSASCPSRLVPS